MEFQRRGFGYKEDLRHLFGFKEMPATDLIGEAAPPFEATLKPYLSNDVCDQGGAPFCVGNAGADALRTCMIRNGNPDADLPARLFFIYLCHALDGDPTLFDGTFIRNLFKVAAKLGFPPEHVWKYSDSPDGPYKTKPDKNVFRLANDQKAPLAYRRILSIGYDRVDDVKRALAAKLPVVFGTAVSNDFASNKGTDKPVDPPSRDIAGLHAMWLWGYKGDVFDDRNSWSKEWGQDGNCQLTADYIAHPSTQDVWALDFKGRGL